MTGNEKFTYRNKNLGFTLLDYWKTKFGNIYNMQDYIAEFIVEKALGMDKSHNSDMWTLYDIFYRGKRVEVKETGYYHPWNENGKISKVRTFGITKANSKHENPDEPNRYERQNDVYVFCLNTGNTKEDSNPMDLRNWEFYIVPTKIIDKECMNNKTISLGKVKQLADMVDYYDIKKVIDDLIDSKQI